MSDFISRYGAILLTGVLLVGLYAQTARHATAQSAVPFHDRARAAIDAIPASIGDWQWDGKETEVPPAAEALLRPNALRNRVYHNRADGWTANLIVIQCRDTRGMSGHYPPNCYPNAGWDLAQAPRPIEMTLWGREVPVSEYQFIRREFNRSAHIVIYNFFILPGRGVIRDMEGVRAASGDYRTRPFGAAQVQVILSAAVPEGDRDAIARTLLEPLGPAVEALQNIASPQDRGIQ
jgi:hypothetical protein